MAANVLFCLKCREPGHDVAHCPAAEWAYWSSSEARSRFCQSIDADATLCSRCNSLDLATVLKALPPWTSQAEFTSDFEDVKGDSIKALGMVGTVKFFLGCPICCCLFAITPTPEDVDQNIFLVPDWTISRVSGELGAVTMDTPEKRQYTTCLLSVLKPTSLSLPIRIVGHRGDALCLLETDIGPEHTLGGRRIDSVDINADFILGWVKKCEKLHDRSCTPVSTPAPDEIRLIDTDSRTIVPYPGSECDYVALSYVCGNVGHDRYKLGDQLKPLPKTLEDALTFTRGLGKRYTWIDSVCIDQSDEVDKSNQIDRMWSIYQGAWITLIDLSGTSAESGIPRLSRTVHFDQLSCQLAGGSTVVSLMPTLSQQIWTCPWVQRAWTLQEGLLSARCLYVSDH